ETFGGDTKKLEAMMYEKTSVFNQFTLEKEKAVNMFRLVLSQKLASDDNYLFYGHHALLIPLDITEVLTVLVADSKKGRTDRAISQGLSEKEAARKMKTADTAAYRWTDFLFNEEAFHTSLYDLTIPCEGENYEEVADSIVSCFRKTSVLRTPESQQAVENFRLASEVEKHLLSKGHTLKVTADNGVIHLTVLKSVVNFDGLAGDLTKLALEVNGVETIEVHKGQEYSESIHRQQKFELPSKVLFVDDEKEFVQTVSQRLISRDVGTYGVYSGTEVLELIAEDQPDVMVLDPKMPGMNGVEVPKKTKELSPEVEVIVLTGHGNVEDEKECMALGAFAYMNKPVDIEELSATIAAAHARNREQKQAA
ncbi:MAG TPA: response regulator, partial [Desulfobacterales bacterium]|nr:response regulator [Desulfobacterales bacterium]